MEFKKQYTEKELNDLAQWFKSNLELLPASFKLDEATSYPDLHFTAGIIIEQATLLSKNATYSGLAHQYFLIRDKLIESGVIPNLKNNL